MTALADHLWQSTLFALFAALLVLTLQKHRAAIRFWLWLAASLKFLIPFGALIRLGALLGSQTAIVETVRPAWPAVLGQISPPLTNAAAPAARLLAPAAAHQPTWWPLLLLALWTAGAVAVGSLFASRWWRIRQAVRAAQPLSDHHLEIPVLSSRTLLEPGVFGIFRPRLILPEGIHERLAREQMAAILAHELCHVRRLDNLWAALHMVVQTLFWFHPLVWWLGARLVEERENACDEQVLQLGNQADVYAESILTVCKFYLESPVMCASGVTGADLKKRIESIMQNTRQQPLTTTRKLLLAGAAACAFATPFLIGLLHPQPIAAQTAAAAFDVASVKPANPDAEVNNVRIMMAPGGSLQISNMPLRDIIAFAYDVRNFQISGAPSWSTAERYEINAKMEAAAAEGPEAAKRLTDTQRQQQQDLVHARLRSLLAERFQLVAHKETKEMSAFVLSVAKNGPKLKEAAEASPDKQMQRGVRLQRGQLSFTSSSIDLLVRVLSNQLARPVVDQTGLKGTYDFELKWVPEVPAGPGPGPDGTAAAQESTGPSVFTALQEQLGLKLEAHKAPTEIIVVDRVDKPSAN